VKLGTSSRWQGPKEEQMSTPHWCKAFFLSQPMAPGTSAAAYSLYNIVAVTPALVWLPTQQPLVLSFI